MLRRLHAGIRNSVGITFHPVTGEMWYTSNGSDHLGGAWQLKLEDYALFLLLI